MKLATTTVQHIPHTPFISRKSGLKDGVKRPKEEGHTVTAEQNVGCPIDSVRLSITDTELFFQANFLSPVKYSEATVRTILRTNMGNNHMQCRKTSFSNLILQIHLAPRP